MIRSSDKSSASSSILSALFEAGKIALEPAHLLARTPHAISRPGLWDRVEGMLLGLAIGDSLGNSSESMLPGARRRAYGEIRDYLPNSCAGSRRAGVPSDDSQLAFWTLEHLLEHGRLIPGLLAERFCSEQIFGSGATVRAFIRCFRDEGKEWFDAGRPSAGNGALMRIAPVLVPHLHTPSPELWADAALAAMITHNDRASTASCIAFVHLLWECLGRDTAPPPEWWIDTFLSVEPPLEGQAEYESRVPEDEYRGPLGRFVDARVRQALAQDLDVVGACNRWFSGAYLLETVPSALYILARHGHDAEEAIVRAVNDTRDNDTVAAIVGAAVGALHGRDALPLRWRERLLGRTRASDDGRVQALIAQARQRFG
jgi:ADP-ribosyl-[dinitrogen reductase] hydrolase